MSEALLGEYPELRPFVLDNVRPTGVKIGSGAYGSVEEVAVPGAICAAKKIHNILLDRSEIPPAEIRRAVAQFVKECQLMSTLYHPNIVQFLGVAFFPGSQLPALVMERLLTSLHDLLDPEEMSPPPSTDASKRNLPFLPLSLKCSILHDIACGIAYLHDQSPPIVHRDLSAKNILLDRGMVAKIVDLGMARIMPPTTRAAATMTTGPGASVYMPPEASSPAKSNSQKSKYDASIDVFSFGIVAIFTIGEVFPCDPLAPTYVNEETGLVVGRTELQRHSEYMHCVNEQLHVPGQVSLNHPLIMLIEKCLHNMPTKRPSIGTVLRLVEEARAGAKDYGWEKISERNIISKVQQQLDSKDKEMVQLGLHIEEIQHQLLTKKEELSERETQLNRAEEVIKRYRQQIHAMENRETKVFAQLKEMTMELKHEETDSSIAVTSLMEDTTHSYCVALYEYNGINPNDLPLQAGDVIELINVGSSDWWKGFCRGKVGYFPTTYVQTVSRGDQIFQSLYDYQPCYPDELCLSEGQIIVVRDNQDGWMFGRSGTEEGLFPGNYTKKLTTV